MEKDFEYEEINKKYDAWKDKDIFSSVNCKVTDLLSSPDRKSILTSLKRVSASLMTCKKLYSVHYDQYGRQEIGMFNQIMNLKVLEQEISQKNVQLKTQVVRLEAKVDKLRFQLSQNNMHEADLYKTFSTQKRKQKDLSENTILKLEQELLKVKNLRTTKKELSRLEVEKLKESLKSSKLLHKDQLQLKETQIVDQNSTIKSMKAKIRQLEKTLSTLESKFATFQCKAASNIAKLENKRELFEVKGQSKRDKENKKREEKEREKELQKRRLEDAVRMHHNLIPSISCKKYQERIINNFRASAYLPPTTTIDWSQAQLSQDSLQYGRNNIVDYTGKNFSDLEIAIPDFESLLRNNFFSDNKIEKNVS